MSNKDASRLIQVTSPCNADWESMIGSETIRFCKHCQLAVHDISEMNRKQIRRLVARSTGRLCIRYEERPKPVLLLHRIGRKTSKIAASAFSASLGLTAAFAAGVKAPNVQQRPPALVSTPGLLSGGGSVLSGVVFDPSGAVVPGAEVSLTNVETKEVINSYSDGTGTYKFESLPAGTFNLKIKAQGFADSDVPMLTLRANDTNRIDQTLSIASVQAEVEVLLEANERVVAVAGGGVVRLPTEPLVKAAQSDDLESVRLSLLEKHDANVRDKLTQDTALEFAVRNANREMIQLLLWAKADVNLKDRNGQTVLMMLGEDVTTEIVWDLLNAGARINQRDNDGETALMAVAQINNVEVLKALIDAGAKVNGSNNEGVTALMLAAQDGYVSNARTLLLAGAEVNVRDKKGKSALTYAEEKRHTNVARLLKSFGAIAFGLDQEKEK